MIPLDQTIFTVPGGNCFAACVASLLEVSLSRVPNFHNEEDWATALAAWLLPRGMYPVYVGLQGGKDAWRPQGLYILGGQSPRGAWGHAVLAKGNVIVHDPHASRDGVTTWDEATLIVKLDPGPERHLEK